MNIDITTDLDAASLVLTTSFEAPVERVWQLWADPRQLERWWGPPTHPATVVDHDLRPDGRVSYFMTGPNGERYAGYWSIVEVDPPTRLVFVDGFADESGTPNDELPTSRAEVRVEAVGERRTRMTIHSSYDTRAELEQVLEMGMEEGLRQAVGQIEAVLAGD